MQICKSLAMWLEGKDQNSLLNIKCKDLYKQYREYAAQMKPPAHITNYQSFINEVCEAKHIKVSIFSDDIGWPRNEKFCSEGHATNYFEAWYNAKKWYYELEQEAVLKTEKQFREEHADILAYIDEKLEEW